MSNIFQCGCQSVYYSSSSLIFFLLVGHSLIAINGEPVVGRKLPDGRDALEVLANPDNFPINLKFGRLKLKTNERIMLASMFHP